MLYSSHVNHKGAESGNAFLREAFILFSPAFAFSSIFNCLYFTFVFSLKPPLNKNDSNLHGNKRLESAFVKKEKYTNCKSCQTYIYFGAQLRELAPFSSPAHFWHYRIWKICRWIVHLFYLFYIGFSFFRQHLLALEMNVKNWLYNASPATVRIIFHTLFFILSLMLLLATHTHTHIRRTCIPCRLHNFTKENIIDLVQHGRND